MKNVFKSFVKKGLTLALSSVVAVSCLPLSCSVDNQGSLMANNELLSAEAYNFKNPGYIKYKDLFDFKNKYLSGKSVISQTYSCSYYFTDNHDKVHRNSDNIPDGMNCTVISVENLLGYYRRKNGYARWKPRNYYFFYNELETLARAKYNYTDKSGIKYYWKNDDFCQEAFSTYGVFNKYSTKEIQITYCSGSMLNTYIPKEPFVISTVSTNHSVLVYGMVKYYLQYTLKNGTRKTNSFDFFMCYDPSGEEFLLQKGKMTDAPADFHQIMYVGNKL